MTNICFPYIMRIWDPKCSFYLLLFSKADASPKSKGKKGKEGRKWNNGGTSKDAAMLDYSTSNGSSPVVNGDTSNEVTEQDVSRSQNFIWDSVNLYDDRAFWCFLFRSSFSEVFFKICVLKILQISQEESCVRVSFW